MSLSDDTTQKVLFQRWRLRLLVVAVVLGLGAVVSLVISLAYGESLVVPALLVAGVACLVMAWRSVPRRIEAEERPTMARSAIWVVLGIVLYVVVPVALSNAACRDPSRPVDDDRVADARPGRESHATPS